MNEVPIRKEVEGIKLNTEISHCLHSAVKVITDHVDGRLEHRHIIQSLYKSPDNHYFLAFWNMPRWDSETLSYAYGNDVSLITPEQAKQWMRTYCPDELENFVTSMDKADKTSSTQTVSLRMSTELRNHLARAESLGGQSLNKVCINLIEAGLSMASSRSFVCLPSQFDVMMMPDRKTPAVDKFEKALKFENPDEQELAGYSETLCYLYRFDYPSFLPFVLRTFYRLMRINKNISHTQCFAEWITAFYRVTYQDGLEYARKNPEKVPNDRWDTASAPATPESQ